ncbi:glycoside hydrolase family 43 protein [Saccharibacillus sacchari]|uniref:glycoside hydrolase family 43 protein n=1 Tax=Saccharibacillus sacchari TaxID=456493 RepID=UPI0012EBD1E7|nr:glycoside hydrolase family 43 protein [Saccharibacillus sacchari]
MPMSAGTEELYGYLFIHFIGENEARGEQIYFALSKDGMYWKDLNRQQPVLTSSVGERGVRDPYLLRSADGERFYLLATDLSIYGRGGWSSAEATLTGSRSLVIWESEDLVNWSEPRLVELAPEEAGCAWAPEVIYDEQQGDYLVFWASSRDAQGGGERGLHIYSSRTVDFRTFTPAEIYISRGENASIIDTTMIRVGDRYYRASGDGQITIESGSRPDGEWEKLSTLESMGLKLTGKDAEGPQFFKLNGEEKWVLLVDRYSTHGGYLPIVTTDIGDTTGAAWRIAEAGEYDFGALKKRHGSVLPITQKEYEAVEKCWGSTVEETASRKG